MGGYNRVGFSMLRVSEESLADKEREIEELSKETNFSEDEIKALHRQYEQMVFGSKGGSIRQEDFQAAFGLGPFEASRLFKQFSRSAQDLSFAQMVKGLSAFSPNATPEEKMRSSFEFFDTNGDGQIDAEEIREVFEQFLEDNAMYVSPEHIQAILEHTLSTFNLGPDGKITFEKYREMVEHHPQLIAAMTISTWQLPEL
eukprot:c26616_g1_i1.p1 GENE.c26616_g1_i1~~c26616_g1_i1.p1  ORF type:complete len:200 (-),score=43.82 c26616_g1_i1:122-721(-)